MQNFNSHPYEWAANVFDKAKIIKGISEKQSTGNIDFLFQVLMCDGRGEIAIHASLALSGLKPIEGMAEQKIRDLFPKAPLYYPHTKTFPKTRLLYPLIWLENASMIKELLDSSGDWGKCEPGRKAAYDLISSMKYGKREIGNKLCFLEYLDEGGDWILMDMAVDYYPSIKLDSSMWGTIGGAPENSNEGINALNNLSDDHKRKLLDIGYNAIDRIMVDKQEGSDLSGYIHIPKEIIQNINYGLLKYLRPIFQLYQEMDSLHEYDINQRISGYQKIAEMAPWDSIAVMSIGTQYHKAQDYENAMKWYQKALTIEPGNPRIIRAINILKADSREPEVTAPPEPKPVQSPVAKTESVVEVEAEPDNENSENAVTPDEREEKSTKRKWWQFWKKESASHGSEASIVIKNESQNRYTNSLGMEFVRISPGTFRMGSPESEPNRGANEQQHEVILTKGFFLLKTPVTQKHFEAVTGENPSRFKNAAVDLPVEQVSWNDIQAFIEKLADREGRAGYRLPTEAEWEYACRAGTVTQWWFGNEGASLADHAWYVANSEGASHPVGEKPANPWGLHDMHGNVWEWCGVWYGDYPDGPATDPQGPETGSGRVVRGGSWSIPAWLSRSAFRDAYDPDFRSFNVGFRLVYVPESD